MASRQAHASDPDGDRVHHEPPEEGPLFQRTPFSVPPMTLYLDTTDPEHEDRQRQYDEARLELSTYDKPQSSTSGSIRITFDGLVYHIANAEEPQDLITEKPDQMFTWFKKLKRAMVLQEKVSGLATQALDFIVAATEQKIQELRTLGRENAALKASRGLSAGLEKLQAGLNSVFNENVAMPESYKILLAKYDHLLKPNAATGQKRAELITGQAEETLRDTNELLQAAHDEIVDLKQVVQAQNEKLVAMNRALSSRGIAPVKVPGRAVRSQVYDDSSSEDDFNEWLSTRMGPRRTGHTSTVQVIDGIKIDATLHSVQSSKNTEHPPTFDGTKGEYRAWLHAVRMKMKASVYPSIEAAMQSVLLWTSGEAFRHLDARIYDPESGHVRNWIHFKTISDMFAFLKMMYDVRDQLQARIALAELEQGNDTFNEFFTKWVKHASYLEMTDEAAIESIRDKLDYEFLVQVAATGLINEQGHLKDFLNLCERVEANLARQAIEKSAESPAQPPWAIADPTVRCPLPEKYTRLMKLTAEDRATMKREGRCMRCRERGHAQYETHLCPVSAEYD